MSKKRTRMCWDCGAEVQYTSGSNRVGLVLDGKPAQREYYKCPNPECKTKYIVVKLRKKELPEGAVAHVPTAIVETIVTTTGTNVVVPSVNPA